MRSGLAKLAGFSGFVVLSLLLGGILVAVPAAAAPSAVDQYLPKLDKGGVGNSQGATPLRNLGATAEEEQAEEAGAQVTKAEEGTSESFTVPATDFSVTPFVALVGAVVLIALAFRAAQPLLSRMGHSVRAR
jgi:hypothetical protein